MIYPLLNRSYCCICFIICVLYLVTHFGLLVRRCLAFLVMNWYSGSLRKRVKHMSMYSPLWSDVVMKSNGSMLYNRMNVVNPFVQKMWYILSLPLLCVFGSLLVPCLFARGSIILVCSTRDEIPFSDELKDSFASISNITWWFVDCMLLIVVIKSSIIALREFSDSLPCSSSRSHYCVKTLVIPLSFVIFPGLYVFMVDTLF